MKTVNQGSRVSLWPSDVSSQGGPEAWLTVVLKACLPPRTLPARQQLSPFFFLLSPAPLVIM